MKRFAGILDAAKRFGEGAKDAYGEGGKISALLLKD